MKKATGAWKKQQVPGEKATEKATGA